MMSGAESLRSLAVMLTIAASLALRTALPALADSGSDPAELERTWAAAAVYVPADAEGYRRIGSAELPAVLAAHSAPVPAVVYAHGCAGIDAAAVETGRFLAGAGYVVVAPDSFARASKPRSCDPDRNVGGLHREVLRWRQEEIGHAIRMLRATAPTKIGKVVLMGLSEGGIAVATFADQPVSARIIEGWTCHAGWPEYRGLAAPPNEAVLALLAADDPWWRAPVFDGDCGAFMPSGGLSRSIVYVAPSPLHQNHWLSFDPSVRREILTFLATPP